MTVGLLIFIFMHVYSPGSISQRHDSILAKSHTLGLVPWGQRRSFVIFSLNFPKEMSSVSFIGTFI